MAGICVFVTGHRGGPDRQFSDDLRRDRTLPHSNDRSWLYVHIRGDAVRSAAIGGEMTDQRGTRSRKLLIRKPYSLRYAVVAAVAAAGCCALQLPAAAATAASVAASGAEQTERVSATA